MNFNISTSTTARVPNQPQESDFREYDDTYSDYYYPGQGIRFYTKSRMNSVKTIQPNTSRFCFGEFGLNKCRNLIPPKDHSQEWNQNEGSKGS